MSLKNTLIATAKAAYETHVDTVPAPVWPSNDLLIRVRARLTDRSCQQFDLLTTFEIVQGGRRLTIDEERKIARRLGFRRLSELQDCTDEVERINAALRESA